jgi:DNA-binding NarL/FixJ family response regulator
METISILIADDHPLFRLGLRTRLAMEADLSVVGEATTGEEAVEVANSLDPDVVLMDMHMPGGGGIEATRRLRSSHPEIAVLVLTMFDDDSVFTAMQAGARGYLLKDAEPEVMVRAIRAVAGGEAIFSPSVAKRVLQYFAGARPTPSQSAFPELTEREREALALLAQGLTNATIADRLALSPKTVRNYVSSIFSKLQVSDRAEAIIRARDVGFGA